MATKLPITPTLCVTPLLDIQNPAFTTSYTNGLKWRLYGEMKDVGLVEDRHVVNSLKKWAELGLFDGSQEARLHDYIGYYIGMIHGGILSPETGEPRPGVTTLVIFHHQDAARGYSVGREYYFHEAQPSERRYINVSLVERLRELTLEMWQFHDEESTWYYSIGCLLGELSGQLFPETAQERHQWEAERQRCLEEYRRTA